MLNKLAFVFVLALLAAGGCDTRYEAQTVNQGPAVPHNPKTQPLADNASPLLKQMLEGAIAQAGVTTEYDPAYVALEYPNGDVPEKTGVCSDVIVRAFRKAGVDLQKEVHEDMKAARSAYPTKWGANAPDKNIDHRRVLNLMKYFDRRGKSLPISNEAADYQPGDVVAWELSNGVDHIGIVTNMLSESADRYLIVHNIGAGTRIEDVVFTWTIKGHYRFF
jgi:uncharacterized protein YijF (DUF1287 family)